MGVKELYLQLALWQVQGYDKVKSRFREEVAMPRIGPTELIIVLFIILIVFGVGRLPEIGGAIGKGIRAFKKGTVGGEEGEGVGNGTTTAQETEEKTKA